jgi:hypothetical protein
MDEGEKCVKRAVDVWDGDEEHRTIRQNVTYDR